MREERLTIDAEAHALRAAHEQSRAEVSLECCDPLRDGLLGDGQLVAGGLELAGVGDRHESAYGVEIHKVNLSLQQLVVRIPRVGCLSARVWFGWLLSGQHAVVLAAPEGEQ